MGFTQQVQKFWEFGAGHTALAAFCAHSVSISIGITQGYSAILLPQLEEDPDFMIIKDSEEESWIASLGAVTNPIGSVISGVLAEYFGRRRSIQISIIPFLLGWLCLGFATDISWLYAGRLITGIAGGMSTACYTYVSEISTPKNRGIFQALGPICASFGILFAYVLGYLVHWKLVSFISIVFGLFSLISIQFLPESPGYLMRKNKSTESFNVFLWLRRNNAEAQAEVDKYQLKNNDVLNTKVNLKDIYLGPQTVKPFFILITLFFLQELSGIYTILFYAVSFFDEANLEMDKYIALIIVGVIRFTVSILAAVLINKYGRKILCIFSNVGFCRYYAVSRRLHEVLRSKPRGRKSLLHSTSSWCHIQRVLQHDWYASHSLDFGGGNVSPGSKTDYVGNCYLHSPNLHLHFRENLLEHEPSFKLQWYFVPLRWGLSGCLSFLKVHPCRNQKQIVK
ncbi:unnamed protein product [Brassicogethes aeneus]|uniref:Major facilitator superfamily (MFS) profile domain-containing protein n=1 Tax=Brassicogethes aeneus TaxID=1431903 RepID=A0A9P0FBV6_BRAAE|nr:unnamed protein product [Brassicogethes aeneus]